MQIDGLKTQEILYETYALMRMCFIHIFIHIIVANNTYTLLRDLE